MIKKLILGLLAVVVILVLVLVAAVAMQPNQFKVERSATFNAKPEIVYAQVNDFHNWTAWSPWEHLDPGMAKTITGPPSGKGASYYWKGNDQVGEGRMTIADAKPFESINVDLEFIQPFAQKSLTAFTFKPDGDKTKMTWTMSGDNNFLGKAFGLFMNMDKMVGGDFERGMSQLKPIVENAPKEAPQLPAPDTKQ